MKKVSSKTDSGSQEDYTFNQQGPPAPAPALKLLEKLIGTWELTGRTLDSKENNISGCTTFGWLPGNFFMQQNIELNFMGMPIKSHEIIGYDPATGKFSSSVYSNMWGQPIPYLWEIEGNNLTIIMPGMARYTGKFSEDGTSMSGGWRPEPGKEGSGNIPYDIWGSRTK